MTFRVDKFGGGVLQTPAQVLRAVKRAMEGAPGVVVVSAFYGVTRLLEEVVDALWEGRRAQAADRWERIWEMHVKWVEGLPGGVNAFEDVLNDARRWMQRWFDHPSDRYGWLYDGVVATGERLAAGIFARVAEQMQGAVRHVSAHSVMITDDTPTRARVDMERTFARIHEVIVPLLRRGIRVVVEGFVGTSRAGRPTTVGKEGSDYTAALVGAAIAATEVTLWKSVPGVLDADPQWVNDAVPLPRLSYDQAEWIMAQGARVIHPRTLAVARTHRFRLVVRSFESPRQHTLISSVPLSPLPSVMVVRPVWYADLPADGWRSFQEAARRIPLELIEWKERASGVRVVGEDNAEKWRIALRAVNPSLAPRPAFRVVTTGRWNAEAPGRGVIERASFREGPWRGMRWLLER